MVASPLTVGVAEALARRLEAEGDVVVAYLFGSQARGTASARSDVDIAVLLAADAGPERHLQLLEAVADVVSPTGADLVVLNDAPVSLAYRVLQTAGSWSYTTKRSGCATGSRRWIATWIWPRCAARWPRACATGSRRVALVDHETLRRRLREIDRRVGRLEVVRGGLERGWGGP